MEHTGERDSQWTKSPERLQERNRGQHSWPSLGSGEKKECTDSTNFLGGTIESVGFIPLSHVLCENRHQDRAQSERAAFQRFVHMPHQSISQKGPILTIKSALPGLFPTSLSPIHLLLLHYNLLSQLLLPTQKKKKSRIEKERRRIWL